VLSDGMGGEAHGESLAPWLSKRRAALPRLGGQSRGRGDRRGSTQLSSFTKRLSHRRIWRIEIFSSPPKKIPINMDGATLTAVWINGTNSASATHSRAILLRGGPCCQITRDHCSWRSRCGAGILIPPKRKKATCRGACCVRWRAAEIEVDAEEQHAFPPAMCCCFAPMD